MKAALALIFFACVAGSMASDVRGQFIDQLVQQGQAVAQTVLAQLQQQVLGLVQQALGQLSSLVASIGRFDFNIDIQGILNQLKPILAGHLNQALSTILVGLSGLIGGRASFDIAAVFNNLFEEIKPALVGIGQHLLNQGLATVLGSLGSLMGSRAISDILAGLQAQVAAAIAAAQSAVTGAVDNLVNAGLSIVDASKPHWEQLQEQLVGHGLNVLGSISETINNLHGSLTGGR